MSDENYSIPGITNPVIPVKANRRKFTAYNGSVNVPIYGPIPVDSPEPQLKIYITLDYGRELEIIMQDTKNAHVFKKLKDANQKAYYLEIDNDEYLLTRGSYKVRVIKDDEEIDEFFIVSKNHPARIDYLLYEWPYFANSNSVSSDTCC